MCVQGEEKEEEVETENKSKQQQDQEQEIMGEINIGWSVVLILSSWMCLSRWQDTQRKEGWSSANQRKGWESEDAR